MIYWIHTDAMNNRRAKASLTKYTSHFIARFACERELETEQRLQHIDLTSPSGHSRVSFSFSFFWCSTGGPGAQLSAECWLSLPQLVTNGSPKLLGILRAPSAGWWLSLPHLVSDFSDPQLTDFLSSLSYIIVQSPTQSPTQSLEWHVWSSSSENNCHAVHRSLSSGASVYECIMGFYLVPFRQPNPPSRFLSITGHGDVSLPSGASLWNGMLAGSKVNIQHFYRALETVTRKRDLGKIKIRRSIEIILGTARLKLSKIFRWVLVTQKDLLSLSLYWQITC